MSKGYFDLEIALDRLDTRHNNAIITNKYGSILHQRTDVYSIIRYKVLRHKNKLDLSKEQVKKWKNELVFYTERETLETLKNTNAIMKENDHILS